MRRSAAFILALSIHAVGIFAILFFSFKVYVYRASSQAAPMVIHLAATPPDEPANAHDTGGGTAGGNATPLLTTMPRPLRQLKSQFTNAPLPEIKSDPLAPASDMATDTARPLPSWGEMIAATSPFGKPGAGRLGPGTGPGMALTVQFNDRDLVPWGRALVYRINSNWIIPAAVILGDRGLVGITVCIEKSGKLARLEVTRSAHADVLNQAALAAVRASAPFYELPAQFPKPQIEAYLVFNYNE